MSFENLGNETFGYLTYHSTDRPSMRTALDPGSERCSTYSQYLKTSTWRKKRGETLRRFSYACALCGFKGKLDVHHRTYERLGGELPEDLVALCRKCHQKHHDIMPRLCEHSPTPPRGIDLVQGFCCQLPIGHGPWHEAEHGGKFYRWSSGLNEDGATTIQIGEYVE